MTTRPGARYARGVERRRALVEAAAAFVLEQGFAALTHRGVAARAGVPLASTTYYFASLDDLRHEAFRHVAEEWTARAAAVIGTLPSRLDPAEVPPVLGSIIGIDAPAAHLLLLYERYLEAGRDDELRPLVIEWNTKLRTLVAEVLARADLAADEATAWIVLAVADGAAITALAEGGAVRDAVAAALARVLPGLLQSPDT